MSLTTWRRQPVSYSLSAWLSQAGLLIISYFLLRHKIRNKEVLDDSIPKTQSTHVQPGSPEAPSRYKNRHE